MHAQMELPHADPALGVSVLTRPSEECTKYSATLQLSKVRPREGQSLAYGHTVSKKPTQDNLYLSLSGGLGGKALCTNITPNLCTNQTLT